MKKKRRLLIIIAAVAVALATAFSLSAPIRLRIVTDAARAQLGKPYVFGEEGPEAFDCSGLVKFCYARALVSVAHYAKTIGCEAGYPVVDSAQGLRPGDVVCFDTVSDGDKCDHVGIWLGQNRFIHASSHKKQVVVSELTGYYLDRFSWGVRIL